MFVYIATVNGVAESDEVEAFNMNDQAAFPSDGQTVSVM